MLKDKSIAVVVPAYNEENQINLVIDNMPDFVDKIIIVNDNSKDKTAEVVENFIKKYGKNILENKDNLDIDEKNIYTKANRITAQKNKEEIKLFPKSEQFNKNNDDKIILINNLKNTGVGGAIARGYKWCKDNNIDCTAVMAGDGQMDPNELESIVTPVVEKNIDYVKGNRFIHKSAWNVVPKIRFFGNSILSILTKIASGYWHVSDTQTGFTAISKSALNSIRLYKIYKNYGMPNDLLVRLNIAFCTIKEVEIKPVYNIGEKSKMKVWKVIPRISWLLFKSFFRRLWVKYLFRDFHPLFLLYHFSFALFIISVPYAIKILGIILSGQEANSLTILAFVFLFISSFQSLLFAMWMDITDNERLYK
ncbi:MAG: glycosyltransferase family 2 protein [Bacteroidota bacterium]|nr:glycosyltransferase family 2 protein [Bacteroidota bacterium]